MESCIICEKQEGQIIWQDSFCRLVSILSANQFGTHRLIWNDHVKELSYLSKPNQNHMFDQLIKAEKFVLKKFNPHKINVASLGNVVPHLHWHIIPRWKTDPWWPNSIWDKIPKAKWSNLTNNNVSKKSDLICVSDWITLKAHSKHVREKVFPSKKESDGWDFVSRHVIIKKENEPIATGRLNPNGKIEKIAVLENFRKQGYGRKVLKKMISEAFSKNISKIQIHCKAHECEFYKAEGFIEDGNSFVKYNHTYQKLIRTLTS